MATWIPNQPVFFGESSICNGDEITINQIVDNKDTTQFQFELDPCISAQQLMPDPNFADSTSYTLARDWVITGGTMCASGDTVAASIASSVFQMTSTSYYMITITVTSISVGGSFYVDLGAGTIGYLTGTGTFTFYGFPNNFFGNTGVNIYPAIAGSDICISSITSYEILTNFIFPIYTNEGTYVTEISYSANPTYFTFVDDTVTVTLDWSEVGLSNNCYYLCLLDPCINSNGQNYPAVITNGTFTGSATGWTLGSDWVYSANTVLATLGGGVKSSHQMYQLNVFNSFSTTYCVTIQITAGTGSVDVLFGTAIVATISGVGTHTVTGFCTSTFTLLLEINSGTSTITTIRACDVLPANYVCNSQSNNFSLADYSANCTKIINACNNENGLGFNFNNSGFTPRIRLEAKLKQAKYSQERTIFEDSLGKKGVVYFNARKTKDLAIDLQPEYVHDFLRLLGGFDNFYIDGELYFVEDDEYSVEYSDASDELGKVKIAVSKRTQDVKNINCSDAQNVCTLPPDYLLRADNLAFRIVQTDGFGILING